jgi:hypothetical protein
MNPGDMQIEGEPIRQAPNHAIPNDLGTRLGDFMTPKRTVPDLIGAAEVLQVQPEEVEADVAKLRRDDRRPRPEAPPDRSAESMPAAERVVLHHFGQLGAWEYLQGHFKGFSVDQLKDLFREEAARQLKGDIPQLPTRVTNPWTREQEDAVTQRLLAGLPLGDESHTDAEAADRLQKELRFRRAALWNKAIVSFVEANLPDGPIWKFFNEVIQRVRIAFGPRLKGDLITWSDVQKDFAKKAPEKAAIDASCAELGD